MRLPQDPVQDCPLTFHRRFPPPLIRAIRWKQNSTAILLVQLGADVNASDARGNTALIEAVRREQSDVISALLKAEVNIHAADILGVTALHAAARTGNEEIVRMLLDGGANANSRSSLGRTPWTIAVHTCKDAALKSILGPDREEGEKMRVMLKDKRPGEIAKYMNKAYK